MIFKNIFKYVNLLKRQIPKNKFYSLKKIFWFDEIWTMDHSEYQRWMSSNKKRYFLIFQKFLSWFTAKTNFNFNATVSLSFFILSKTLMFSTVINYAKALDKNLKSSFFWLAVIRCWTNFAINSTPREIL